MGSREHMRECARDDFKSILYQINEYGSLLGLSVKGDAENNAVYTLTNLDNSNENVIIKKNVVDSLLGDVVLWDMMGTEREYETWESKLRLIERYSKLEPIELHNK